MMFKTKRQAQQGEPTQKPQYLELKNLEQAEQKLKALFTVIDQNYRDKWHGSPDERKIQSTDLLKILGTVNTVPLLNPLRFKERVELYEMDAPTLQLKIKIYVLIISLKVRYQYIHDSIALLDDQFERQRRLNSDKSLSAYVLLNKQLILHWQEVGNNIRIIDVRQKILKSCLNQVIELLPKLPDKLKNAMKYGKGSDAHAVWSAAVDKIATILYSSCILLSQQQLNPIQLFRSNKENFIYPGPKTEELEDYVQLQVIDEEWRAFMASIQAIINPSSPPAPDVPLRAPAMSPSQLPGFNSPESKSRTPSSHAAVVIATTGLNRPRPSSYAAAAARESHKTQSPAPLLRTSVAAAAARQSSSPSSAAVVASGVSIMRSPLKSTRLNSLQSPPPPPPSTPRKESPMRLSAATRVGATLLPNLTGTPPTGSHLSYLRKNPPKNPPAPRVASLVRH